MLRDGVARVLVADRDVASRKWAASLLSAAGYSVTEAGDVEQGIVAVHGSANPLIVLSDASCRDMLQVAAADRRLVAHHAYVLLCADAERPDPVCQSLLRRLTLFLVRKPAGSRAVLDAVARAHQALFAHSK
jgi:CheY-like chemotaxis protein